MSRFICKKMFTEYLVSFKDMILEFAEIEKPDDDIQIDIYSPTHAKVGITSITPPSGNMIMSDIESIINPNEIFDNFNPEPHSENMFHKTGDYTM